MGSKTSNRQRQSTRGIFCIDLRPLRQINQLT